MDVTMNQTAILTIRTVASKLQGGKLQNLQEVENDLQQLNEYFGTTSTQTAFFVAIFGFHCWYRKYNSYHTE